MKNRQPHVPGNRLFPVIFAALVLAAHCSPESGDVRDDVGRTVSVPTRVRRVITLAPNLSEIADAVGATDRLVGTDDFSDFPAAVGRLPKVGGLQPSIERIASLTPDLVLASSSGNHPSLGAALAAIDVPLYVVRTDRIDDVRKAFATVGRLLGGPRTAVAISTFDRELAARKRSRARRPRVLFVLWASPLYVAGRSTFVDDLLVLTGGENAVPLSAGPWPQYSLEALIADPPDLILHPSASLGRDSLDAIFRSDPRWLSVEAVKRGMIFGVDEDLFTRPGPRLIDAAAGLNTVLDRWERSQ